MNIEVLVTTMHQSNFSKYSEMNLQTDAIIANQTDFNAYMEEKINNHTVKFISTNSRGLSRNRNIALEFSTADYILFADDDMRLVDDYETIVEQEFAKHPEAEAIKFTVNSNKNGRRLSWNGSKSFEKATRRSVTSAGVPALVIKKAALIRCNLHFHENFGTGTENYCGEDTIFLQEMLNKGVRFYLSPTVISEITQGQSSWFNGYNEKYFITSGKVISEIYPKLSYLIVIRSAYKFSKRKNCEMKFKNILKCYYKGIKETR